MKKSSSGSHPIVGIVASAGGLEAFKKFFSAMPADSGLAFVLVPHLDPSHESMMVDLLGKLTPMLIVEAKQGMAVLPNCIYIIPPNCFLSISQGMLQLSPPPEGRGWRTSMDYFLRSLAQDQGEQAIGIVLSGTGSHGSLGIREVKHSGGMAMAQKPDTAEYDQMPIHAIGTGVIDYVLPPEQMPAALLSYLKQPYLHQEGHEKGVVEQESELLNRILAVLESQAKYDFRSYRKPMVLRRLQRRMGIAQIDNLSEYLEFLRGHPEEATALCKDLLISVTAFFRDPEAYQVLEKEVLPALIAKHKNNLPIRVWVAACASGEEAYSIAMLLIEAMDIAKSSIKIQIFASDIDLNAIEAARAGIYPASIAEDVSPERLRKFFVMLDEHHYQIHKRVREIVVFSHQNLIGDAPFSKIDLISCRNLLIYLELKMQKNVITLFHFALVAGGYLFLGPSESVGRSNDLFEPISKKWRLFRRLESVKRDVINIPFRKTTEPDQPRVSNSAFAASHRGLREITEQLVLNEYAPAAALCNESLEVLYVTGPLVGFFGVSQGRTDQGHFGDGETRLAYQAAGDLPECHPRTQDDGWERYPNQTR
jgi:two-component system CheB/CheR fusion protein